MSLISTSSSTFFLLTSYVFYKAGTPPQPPASAHEIKGKQHPYARIITSVIVFITCGLMATDAYANWIGGYKNDPAIFNRLCTVDDLSQPYRLSLGAIAGNILLLMGGYIRTWAQRTLGEFFTWEIAVKQEHRLVVSGPYSIVRHPGYLGLLMLRMGISTLHVFGEGTVFYDCLRDRFPVPCVFWMLLNGAAMVGFTVWMGVRSMREDDLMKEEFGEAWERWAARTRYRILPLVF